MVDGVERGRGLLADRGEDLLGLDSSSDQGGDAPQRGLLVGDALECFTCLGVCDCGRDKLGELAETGFRPLGNRLRIGRDGDDHAPEAALDGQRRTDRRSKACAACDAGDLALQGAVVVDARRALRAGDRRHHARVLQRPRASGRERVLARRGDDGPGVVTVVPNELDPLQPQEARGLVDDGREDLLGCGAGGDEGRDSSESSLLLAEPPNLVVRLRVRERRGDQIGERGQPLLGAGGKRLRPLRGDQHDAPQATLDDDRGRDRRAPAMPARDVRGLARGVVVAVDPRRPFRLRDERQDVVAAEERTSSHGHPARRCAPASGRRCRSVAVIPADDRDVGVEQRADLHRNGIEDLAGRSIASDERRDTPKRSLLVREACESVMRLGVRNRGCEELGEVEQPLLRPGRKRLYALAATEMWPQTLPSTTIGEPAAARIDESCMAAATAPPRPE